jgi:hypothetical protein
MRSRSWDIKKVIGRSTEGSQSVGSELTNLAPFQPSSSPEFYSCRNETKTLDKVENRLGLQLKITVNVERCGNSNSVIEN